ncbi:MAG: hypothetical protein AB2L14_36210 [Candidatus Xenobiia bacterium LiM19]
MSLLCTVIPYDDNSSLRPGRQDCHHEIWKCHNGKEIQILGRQ